MVDDQRLAEVEISIPRSGDGQSHVFVAAGRA